MKYEIIDNAYSAQDRWKMYDFARNSRYVFGWAESGWEDVNGHRRVLHSNYSLEDVENMGVLRLHNSSRIDELIGGRTPVKQVINLAAPSDTFNAHTHPDKEVFIYYCNFRWNPEWAGETIIYSEHEYEAEHAITFRPGRVLWLNAGVMHTLRPPSQAAPEHRFTFAALFNREEGSK